MRGGGGRWKVERESARLSAFSSMLFVSEGFRGFRRRVRFPWWPKGMQNWTARFVSATLSPTSLEYCLFVFHIDRVLIQPSCSPSTRQTHPFASPLCEPSWRTVTTGPGNVNEHAASYHFDRVTCLLCSALLHLANGRCESIFLGCAGLRVPLCVSLVVSWKAVITCAHNGWISFSE